MLIHYVPDSSKQLHEAKDGVVGEWLRLERPTSDDKAVVVGLGLDVDILHDALDPHEVPRLDIEGDWTYFITRVPDIGDNFNDYTTPVLFAFNPDQLITVSRDNLGRLWQPFVDKTRIAKGQRKLLFLMMVDEIAKSYQDRVSHINRQARGLTNNISRLRSKELALLVEYERKLNDYLDALIPTNTALEMLLNSRQVKFRDDDLDEIEDLSIDLEQVIARCKSLLRTIQNVRDSYRAVMNIRLNETMRALTIVTVVLTIPTMLAGLLGMNVKLPFDVDSGLVFWEIVGASTIAALAVSLYFAKK